MGPGPFQQRLYQILDLLCHVPFNDGIVTLGADSHRRDASHGDHTSLVTVDFCGQTARYHWAVTGCALHISTTVCPRDSTLRCPSPSTRCKRVSSSSIRSQSWVKASATGSGNRS